MAKKDNTPQTPYKAFDGFLENFKDGNTYIKRTKETFDKNIIQSVYEAFKKYSQKDGKDKKFEEVIEDLRKNNSSKETFDIINHAIWLWCLPNKRKSNWAFLKVADKKKSKEEKKIINKENNNLYRDELLQLDGVAGGGSGYVQTKTNGVRFILFLFTQLGNEAGNEAKKIEET